MNAHAGLRWIFVGALNVPANEAYTVKKRGQEKGRVHALNAHVVAPLMRAARPSSAHFRWQRLRRPGTGSLRRDGKKRSGAGTLRRFGGCSTNMEALW